MSKMNTMEDMKSTENVGFFGKLKAAVLKIVDVILYII